LIGRPIETMGMAVRMWIGQNGQSSWYASRRVHL